MISLWAYQQIFWDQINVELTAVSIKSIRLNPMLFELINQRILRYLTKEWVERRRREWDEHVITMNAERLVKISRDNVHAGRRSPGRQERGWSDLIPG